MNPMREIGRHLNARSVRLMSPRMTMTTSADRERFVEYLLGQFGGLFGLLLIAVKKPQAGDRPSPQRDLVGETCSWS
jgi:hypothetical protein